MARDLKPTLFYTWKRPSLNAVLLHTRLKFEVSWLVASYGFQVHVPIFFATVRLSASSAKSCAGCRNQHAGICGKELPIIDCSPDAPWDLFLRRLKKCVCLYKQNRVNMNMYM